MDNINNLHPISQIFRNELGGFIDDHFELEFNEYNQKFESTEDHTSFAHSFYHGITSIYPDERRLTPKTRSFFYLLRILERFIRFVKETLWRRIC